MGFGGRRHAARDALTQRVMAKGEALLASRRGSQSNIQAAQAQLSRAMEGLEAAESAERRTLMRMRAREEHARLGVVGPGILPNEDEPTTADAAVRKATTSDAIADAKRGGFQPSPFHISTLAAALPAAPQVGPLAHLGSDGQDDGRGDPGRGNPGRGDGLDSSVGLDRWWAKPAGATPRGYSNALRSASYSRRSMSEFQPAAAAAKHRHRPAIDSPVPIWERLNRTSWGRRRVHHDRGGIDGSLATHGRYIDGSHQAHDREDACRPSRGLPFWSRPAVLAASRLGT